MRIGFGYDIHKLVKGHKLIIGGVDIPCEKGELGHSDGDVLIHALIDALLGAAALGDIGTHFPPDDPRYKDISSRVLLAQTLRLVSQTQWSIVNVDCTIILEKPRLRTFVARIREQLAHDLDCTPATISIKCKTKEGLDCVGQEQAIEAYSAVLLQKRTS
jgi:2-C-methyl-D-erythritol 2,4-cyclodiphosphate synthase